MPTPAHELIQTVNITSSVSQTTISSIPQGYRDLQLIATIANSPGGNGYYRLNNDSGFNYDIQIAEGNGSTTAATGNTSADRAYTSFSYNIWGTTSSDVGVLILDIFDYSTTDRYKFGLHRASNSAKAVNMAHNMYKSNSAITRIDAYIECGSGSKFVLYGIRSEEA